jgi:RimJ/RimL family protein N-acetyltransferase
MGEGWAEPWAYPLPWPPLADRATAIGLRPWGAGEHDAEALVQGWADPDVERWTAVPEDRSLEAAQRWIRGDERRRAEGVSMDLVISGLDAPHLVHGEIGFAVVDADKRWAELGWWLFPDARGAGRASAAARAVADWTLRELPVERLIARTQPDNPGAGRVAEAAGLTHAGDLDTGTQVWVRDRPS